MPARAVFAPPPPIRGLRAAEQYSNKARPGAKASEEESSQAAARSVQLCAGWTPVEVYQVPQEDKLEGCLAHLDPYVLAVMQWTHGTR